MYLVAGAGLLCTRTCSRSSAFIFATRENPFYVPELPKRKGFVALSDIDEHAFSSLREPRYAVTGSLSLSGATHSS